MRFSFQWLRSLVDWHRADNSAIAEATCILRDEDIEVRKHLLFQMLVDIMPDSIIDWADPSNRELANTRISSRESAWLDICERLEHSELAIALHNTDWASMHRIISEITWVLSVELTGLMGFEFMEVFMTLWRGNLFWNLGRPDYDILNEFVLQRQRQEVVK